MSEKFKMATMESATTTTTKRRKIFEVEKNPPRMFLTERDKEIIRAVYSFRMLTREQIQKLLFPMIRREVPQRRLKYLYHHRYLERVPLPVSDHPLAAKKPVYRLAPRGAEQIAQEQDIELKELLYWGRGDDKDHRDTQVTSLFLEHELAVNEVRIAVTLSAQKHKMEVEKWLDEPTLRGFRDSVTITNEETGRKQKVTVIPDAYFLLVTPRRAHFELEVDRSTMTLTRWKQKIMAYEAYIYQGYYEKRFKVRTLRILTVATSAERLKHLREVTEAVVKQKEIYWFALLEQILSQDILTDPIWRIAGKEEFTSLIA